MQRMERMNRELDDEKKKVAEGARLSSENHGLQSLVMELRQESAQLKVSLSDRGNQAAEAELKAKVAAERRLEFENKVAFGLH